MHYAPPFTFQQGMAAASLSMESFTRSFVLQLSGDWVNPSSTGYQQGEPDCSTARLLFTDKTARFPLEKREIFFKKKHSARLF